jgi:hypothetical protein
MFEETNLLFLASASSKCLSDVNELDLAPTITRREFLFAK